MAKKEDLRRLRKGTVINVKSGKMESLLGQALVLCRKHLESEYEVAMVQDRQILIEEIVTKLKTTFTDVDFHFHKTTSALRPDGGILYIISSDQKKYPILISEAKRQGTNDDREKEGLKKQAQGNAIERLGKNVIGFRTMMTTEDIFPLIVFGQGVDFADDSSIRDRVTTIAMFAPLNRIEVRNQGDRGQLARGSFFFRVEPWTVDEMVPILIEIAQTSIEYYLAKYGDSYFIY